MLEAGEYLCQKCRRRSTKAFYTNAKESTCVELKHLGNPSGRRCHYMVVPADYKDNRNKTELKKVRLAPGLPLQDYHGLPPMIKVYVGEEKTPVEYKRACPYCGVSLMQNNECMLGQVPSMVVVLVANRNEGKSAWCSSMVDGDNQKKLAYARYPYMINFGVVTRRKQLPETTSMDDSGESLYMSVVEEKTNRPVAGVYLIDVAGEVWLGEKDAELKTLRDTHKIDGVFYMERTIVKDQSDNPNGDNIAFQLVQSFPTDIPIGYIRTMFDELIDQSGHTPDGVSNQRIKRTPLPMIPEKYFRNYSEDDRGSGVQLNPFQYFNKDVLQERIPIENLVAREIVGDGGLLHNTNTMGFLIQSWKPYDTERSSSQGRQEGDPHQNMNLYDPLIWMLNRLNIFPLE